MLPYTKKPFSWIVGFDISQLLLRRQVYYLLLSELKVWNFSEKYEKEGDFTCFCRTQGLIDQKSSIHLHCVLRKNLQKLRERKLLRIK